MVLRKKKSEKKKHDPFSFPDEPEHIEPVSETNYKLSEKDLKDIPNE
jgi:hypothetical protein